MDQQPRGRRHSGVPGGWPEPLRYTPAVADVDALIDAARQHPLGIDFLMHGHLGSVAVTFQTHAFTVAAARDRLAPR